MDSKNKWYLDHRLWLEGFVLVNLGFLSLDIYLAHSINRFAHPAEYIPFYFSFAAPGVLLLGLVIGEWRGVKAVSRDLGYLVGWLAVIIGCVGVIYHLDSRFFHEHTLKSLIYAAPFAAPLAYTGLGLLLILNRMVASESPEWPRWVLLLALGGFVGNFLFSLTDHAQNGFFHSSEWIPVISSALAVGFLCSPFATAVTRRFVHLCFGVMVLQIVVGLLGFYLHVEANLHGPHKQWLENFIFGAPALAPLLLPNLALLGGIGLWVLREHLPTVDDVQASGPGLTTEPEATTQAPALETRP